MKSQLHFSLLLAATLFCQTALAAQDVAALAGKWSVKKANEDGQNFMHTITVTKDKFVFQILGADDHLVLYAEGDLKLEKLGPFAVARFVNIRAGASASDIQGVDDEYISAYTLDGDTWTMAAGFDKVRDRQKPSLDIYHRVKASAESKTLVIDEIEMADTPQSATWFFCFETKVEGVVRNYHIEGKGYEKNQVTIPVRLELPKIRAGQTCSFTMKLDDVEEDACTEEVDNKSTGEFLVSDKGSQTFKPEDNWRYTIRWHLK